MDNHLGRRKSTRSILMLDPLLLDKEGRVLARVADLSPEGAMLYARGEPFAVGSKISGWLDAPAFGDLDKDFVAVRMTVAWRVAEPLGWFKLGCSFDGHATDARRRIERLILALRAPERGVIHGPIPD